MAFIEVSPATEKEWLELRTSVVTASDVGVILGLNRWKSVREMLSAKQETVPFENSYTWLGQTMEPLVVKAVNKVLGTNFKLYEDDSRKFFVDKEIRLGATPDAYEGDILLECKSTKPANFFYWWGFPPVYYASQLYTQLICTGKKTGYLAIMSTNMSQSSAELNIPIHIHQLTRTEKFDILILNEVKRFWHYTDNKKLYRVDRKQALSIELQLRTELRRIYG